MELFALTGPLETGTLLRTALAGAFFAVFFRLRVSAADSRRDDPDESTAD